MRKLIYQMLPRLWGSGEHFTGKFSAVDDATLSYLKDLGFTDIWCTGILRHATQCTSDGCTPSHPQFVKGEAGSPYAINDYYDVNPYLADNSDKRMPEFESLLKRVHAAGMKFILDFVPNHVARDYHGSMTPAGESRLGENDDTSVHWSPDNDFFYYPGEHLRLPVPSDRPFEEYPAKASGNAFTPAPGVNDWYETVKINYCEFHTPTWDKMLNILLYWAGKGIDGFRCDMVELVPRPFFTWAIAEVKRQYPDVFFVAEVYEKESYRAYAEEVGFDYLYDKSCFYDHLRAVTEGWASATSLTWCWQFLGNLQPRMLQFLENHDEQRIASDFFAGKAKAGLAAFAVDALFSTSPLMVYFGQEAGERGMDNEPFSGVNGRTSIFDWCHPKAIKDLYRYIHGEDSLTRDEKSILGRYREILSLATREKAFSEGVTYDLCYCQGSGFDADHLFAWLRHSSHTTYLVVANFAKQISTVEVTVPAEAFEWLGMTGPDRTVAIHIPALDFRAVKL